MHIFSEDTVSGLGDGTRQNPVTEAFLSASGVEQK